MRALRSRGVLCISFSVYAYQFSSFGSWNEWFFPDIHRAKSASTILGTGTPSLRAASTVHPPVPLLPALSLIFERRNSSLKPRISSPISPELNPPSLTHVFTPLERGTGSWVPRISTVISSRKLFRSPELSSWNIFWIIGWGISANRSISYTSAIPCMMAYSIPLCTIFTKLPAAALPTKVTQGLPAKSFAAIFSSIGSIHFMTSSSPPGISDGQSFAHSEPPEIPHPIQWIPCSVAFFWLAIVVSQWALPRSQIASPDFIIPRSSAAISFVTFPAGTSKKTCIASSGVERRESSVETNSERVSVGMTLSQSFLASSWDFEIVRFHTITDISRETKFCKRFSPIVPSQMSPIVSIRDMWKILVIDCIPLSSKSIFHKKVPKNGDFSIFENKVLVFFHFNL